MIRIGLVNNMSAPAVPSTERQFTDILHEAASGLPIEVGFFRLVGARPPHYGRLDDLLSSRIDGLIVTGAEPRAESLSEEPTWDALTQLADWAADHTASAIWSCLAAHAVVAYYDGIERSRQTEKIFGLFPTAPTIDHPLLTNARPVWLVPHSRWNDLVEDDLIRHGYTVLAKSPGAGVDMFCKDIGRSLFLFVQAHPEYDATTLLREYARDVNRYRNGQQTVKPRVPRNYVPDDEVAALEGCPSGGVERLRAYPVTNEWRPIAVQIYRNWLRLIAARQQVLV